MEIDTPTQTRTGWFYVRYELPHPVLVTDAAVDVEAITLKHVEDQAARMLAPFLSDGRAYVVEQIADEEDAERGFITWGLARKRVYRVTLLKPQQAEVGEWVCESSIHLSSGPNPYRVTLPTIQEGAHGYEWGEYVDGSNREFRWSMDWGWERLS
jgi:hypothetical protein